MSSTKTASNTTAATRVLQVNDHSYAYRRFGHGSGLPLLCLQHFTGTLDNWDPAVTDPHPDAGHGSLFQYADSFTRHAGAFLSVASESAVF
jgi:hypothetical protein